MKQSSLFTKTRREAPADEVSKNAILLTRAGFINKEIAGVYSLLPLGLRVVNKIKKIVSKEMEALGSSEILMSTLQPKELWEKTDRWSDEKVDVWFKSALKNGSEVGFGWSHEEPITNLMVSHISSYNDLPQYVHQFQNKLRNEVRAKSGIMRCREFIMKDMYSYSRDEKEHMEFYDKTTEAYLNVFKKVGLGDITYVTSASGGVFTDKFSHEFQTICEAGEDNIYVHKDGKLALNEEIFNDETLEKLGAKKEDFEMKKAVEVGNIFTFGTKKCEELGLYFTDKEGNKTPAFLGSYGIGITRLMGVLAEVFADEKGMVWPKEVAPFRAHLISLGQHSVLANEVYEKLQAEGVEILYDDRNLRAGEKFADADLIGIPTRVVIGDKSLESKLYEVKERNSDEVKMLSLENLIAELKQ
ncbi:MAG: His/Gly/Thr/Pro-type tRNA ligase C-terminal domain-containing protein [Candidatus Zambryskibacteria bacterium]|nr:His/Gly/Thr/Pro-type tRNA ligase C-terminal domain-containing protein [Candidatus Zambryskibacteria bacterium]